MWMRLPINETVVDTKRSKKIIEALLNGGPGVHQLLAWIYASVENLGCVPSTKRGHLFLLEYVELVVCLAKKKLNFGNFGRVGGTYSVALKKRFSTYVFFKSMYVIAITIS
jgi:hypothetical protein